MFISYLVDRKQSMKAKGYARYYFHSFLNVNRCKLLPLVKACKALINNQLFSEVPCETLLCISYKIKKFDDLLKHVSKLFTKNALEFCSLFLLN